MATMYRRSDSGNYRVEYFVGGRRHSLTLTDANEQAASKVCEGIEQLVAAKKFGQALHPTVQAWVDGLLPETRDKFAKAGLVSGRPSFLTLSQVIDSLTSQIPISPAGEAARRQAHKSLVEYFKAGRHVHEISRHDGIGWWNKLQSEPLAPATLAKRLKDAKAVFNFAIREGVVVSNPLAGIRGPSQRNAMRATFVPIPELEIFLKAADKHIAVLVALARLAGLRCPSEAVRLTWAHVDFAGRRLLVPQAKLACGGTKPPVRECPLRKLLADILLEYRPLKWQPQQRVFSGEEAIAIARAPWRHVKQALRKAKMRLWEKPFPNLRASYVTELRRNNISPVAIAEWAGHSIETATKHYEIVRPEDWQLAIELPGVTGDFKHSWPGIAV